MDNTQPSLAQCQQAIGYTFNNPQLLDQSLTHASLSDQRVDSNERLEFLGDAVLGLLVCHELYRRFPLYLEGELTKVKSMLVSRRTCSRLAQEIGLHRYLRVGKGMLNHRRIPSSCLAAVFESVVGAIYLDGGKDAAWNFLLRWLEPLLQQADADQHQENYKSLLQQYAQRKLDLTPHYELLDEKGPDHSKCFEICVALGTRRFLSAWGPSKKEAEQLAAFNALRELNLISDETPFAPVNE
ncbi:MAG: ribonuclease III [Sedimentisphaerales bacterium]|nr:ribonuclease III [Sedimentisphaerales bacterium]